MGTLAVCGILASRLRSYTADFPNFTFFDGILVMVTCWVGLAIIGGYDRKRDMCTLSYASEHFLAMGAVITASFLVTYVFSAYNNLVKPGRSVLVLGFILFFPLALVYRRILSRRVSLLAAARFICVAGTRELASQIETICRQASFGHPLRFIEFEVEKQTAQGQKSAARAEDDSLELFLSGPLNQCEGIVIDLARGRLNPELEGRLLNLNLHTVPVYPVDSFIETYFHKIDLDHVTLSWALDGTFNADDQSNYGKIKSLIETVVALSLFCALLPLMVLTALVIKVTDSGPVLFRQIRVGRFDKPFVIYKFRTMTVSEDGNQGLYTLKDDSRITKVGRFLRLTRLDELPQLWNVIQGDMSLIGPRAEWDKLAKRYQEEIPFYHLRHMVKPGITGWAQVNFGYGAGVGDAREKLQYDLYYIKHYSPEMDASIILKTLFTMISASGR